MTINRNDATAQTVSPSTTQPALACADLHYARTVGARRILMHLLPNQDLERSCMFSMSMMISMLFVVPSGWSFPSRSRECRLYHDPFPPATIRVADLVISINMWRAWDIRLADA